MRRIAGIALCVIGLIVALVGIASSVLGRSDNKTTAVAKGGSAPYIYTAPGVLDVAGSTVMVRISGAKKADVTVAFGTSKDVEAWAEGVKAKRITGLKDWENLSVKDVDGTAQGLPALKDSDMWIETKTAKGVIEETYNVDKPGAISLIATSSDGKAPQVSLTWQRDESRSVAVPVIVIGVLLLLIGGALLALERQEARQRAERLALRERKEARRVARASAETTVLAASGAAPGRSAEGDGRQAAPGANVWASPPDRVGQDGQGVDQDGRDSYGRSLQDTSTGRAFGAGILMSSPRSQEIRGRELAEGDRIVIGEEGTGASLGEFTSVADGFPELDDAPTATGIPTISEASSAAILEDSPWRSRWSFVDDGEDEQSPRGRESDDGEGSKEEN